MSVGGSRANTPAAAAKKRGSKGKAGAGASKGRPETPNAYGFYDTAGNPGFYFGQKTKWKDSDTFKSGQANAAKDKTALEKDVIPYPNPSKAEEKLMKTTFMKDDGSSSKAIRNWVDIGSQEFKPVEEKIK